MEAKNNQQHENAAVKLKTVKVSLLDILGLRSFLYQFRIPTRGDLQRVDELIQVCDGVEKTRMGIIENFKNENGLHIETNIDEYSIHFSDLKKKIEESKIDLNPKALARFTRLELDSAVDGIGFTYAQRKFLDQMLLKNE